MKHCPKYAAGVLCHCHYCATMAWLELCEDEIRKNSPVKFFRLRLVGDEMLAPEGNA